MLVITRRKDQEIVIVTSNGEKILLKLLHCSPASVKIGLEAEQDIRIIRGEVIERMKLQTQV